MKKLLYTALFAIANFSSWHIIAMEPGSFSEQIRHSIFLALFDEATHPSHKLWVAYLHSKPQKFESYLKELGDSVATEINTPVYPGNSATLLHYVLAHTHSNQKNIIQKLITHGANCNARNNAGDTPLISGAKSGNYHAMRILLETATDTIDVDARNNEGQSAFSIVCGTMHLFLSADIYNTILQIIEHPKFSTQPAENRIIPKQLIQPFTNNDTQSNQSLAKKILRKLLVKNFYIPHHPELIETIFGKEAHNAYLDAGKAKNTDTLNAALKSLDDIFTRQIAQETLAVHKNSERQETIFELENTIITKCMRSSEKEDNAQVISCLEQLEKLGVKKLTLKDRLGNTALHWAAEMGNTQLIAPLLHYGAYAEEKNREGKTAYDLAKAFKHKETMEEFEHPKQWVVPAGIAALPATTHPSKEDSGPDGFDDNNGAAARFSEQPTQKDSIEPRTDTKKSSTKLWRSLKKLLLGAITLVTTAYAAYSLYSQHQKTLLDRSTELKQNLLFCLERGDANQAYALIEAQQEAWTMLPEADRQHIQNRLNLYLR